ncbi:hypothetical protein T4E_9455 [Trichinella pseudospiralis]|uniref:Uncharacterized protein n=1 Tax=Trichinella pseudospiralis TaxID=6337 RepID=A0A0V0XSE0_TRIPS|nr:hypothetical protein T4E_9455 [Trichinella pseudospiralis]
MSLAYRRLCHVCQMELLSSDGGEKLYNVRSYNSGDSFHLKLVTLTRVGNPLDEQDEVNRRVLTSQPMALGTGTIEKQCDRPAEATIVRLIDIRFSDE